MKKLVYNKTFRCVVSLIATFAVIFSSFTYIPEFARAGYEENVNFSFSIVHDGESKPINEVDTVTEGDGVDIAVEWTLSDGNKLEGSEIPYTRIIQLDPRQNLNIPSFTTDLLFGSRKVGTAAVLKNDEDKLVMVMDITDEEYLTGENNRLVRAVINGTLESGGTVESGDDITFGIAETGGTYTMKYDDGTPVSSLSVYKSAGTLTKESGDWYQYFTVYVSAQNGPVKDIKFIDTPGDIFVNGSLATLESMNVVTASGAKYNGGADITDGQSLAGGLSDLNDMSLDAWGSVAINYKVKVNADAFTDGSYDWSQDGNKIKATYKDNKKNDKTTPESEARVTINKPFASKVLNSGANDDSQRWTITINLGTAGANGTALSDFLATGTPVIDTLPEGMELVSGTLTPVDTDFVETYPGSGVYTYTYMTKLTDAQKALESTVLTNKVEVISNDGPLPVATATYTTSGVPTNTGVDKEFVSETDGVITWSVTLKEVSPSYTNVIVKDDDGGNTRWDSAGVGKTWGSHSVNNTIVYTKGDGTKVVLVENGVITTQGDDFVASNYAWEGLKFKDEFITSNNGEDIVLTYTSKINDADMKNKVYSNKAVLNYYNGSHTLSREDTATYEKTVFPVNALKKNGVPNNGNSTIKYTLTVDLYEMENLISSGTKNLVITDKLPDGLVYDDTVSVTLEDKYKDAYNGEYKVTGGFYRAPDQYNQYFLNPYDGTMDSYNLKSSDVITTYTAAENTLTFTIPVDADNYRIVKGYLNMLGAVDRFVNISFTAKISDEHMADFVKSTAPSESFENKAEGKFDGIDINTSPAIDVSSLTPPSFVTKVGRQIKPTPGVFTMNAILWEIDVNPTGTQLNSTPGGKITGVDTMGRVLSYYLDSIKVEDVTTSTALEMGNGANQYTYTFDEANNKLTFKVPDGKHLKISYYGLLNVYAGTEKPIGSPAAIPINAGGTSNSTVDVDNNFVLTADTSLPRNTSGLSGWSVTSASYGAMAFSDTGNVTIDKFTTLEGVKTKVTGAVFDLYSTSHTGSGATAVYDKDAPVTGKTNLEIPDSGKLMISGLYYNTVYALVETAGGVCTVDGQSIAMKARGLDEPYYFVIPNVDTNTANFPENVHIIATGNFLEFENVSEDAPELKTITISKKVVAGSSELTGASLKVYVKSEYDSNPETAVAKKSWTSTTAPQSLTVGATGDLEFDKEYILVEEGAPAGYKYADSIAFMVESSGMVKRVGSGVNGEFDGSTLTMRDAVMDSLYVSKQDLAGEEIDGAKLSIYKWNLSGNTIDGTVIESWTSSSTDSHKIDVSKFKQSKGSNMTYYMIEELAADVPAGYTQIVDANTKILSRTVFHIDENGKMIVDKCLDDGGLEILTGTTGYSTVGAYDAVNKTIIDGAVSNGLRIFNARNASTITISKKAIAGGAELAGASLAIYKKSDFDANDLSLPVESWMSGTTAKSITIGVDNGASDGVIEADTDYVLYEFAAPDGYTVISKFEFRVSADGTITNISGAGNTDVSVNAATKTIDVIDKAIVIYIDKQNKADNSQLSNATLALYVGTDTTDNTKRVSTWSSTASDARKIQSTMLKGDNTTIYTLVETVYPLGFTQMAGCINKYTFTIDANGKITNLHQYASSSDLSSSNYAATNNAVATGDYDGTTKTIVADGTDDNGIILYNTKADTSISISKKAIGGTAELAGAQLSIYKEADYDGNTSVGTAITGWISTSLAKEIVVSPSVEYSALNAAEFTSNGGKLASGNYWLVEDGAPAGYAYTEAIKFNIDSEGKISILNSTGEVNADSTKLTMRDKIFTIKILKRDKADGTAVSGAYLKLEDINAAPIVVDQFYSGDSAHEIAYTNLIAGHKYKLTETIAPSGYNKLFNEITFEIDKNGKIVTSSTSLQYLDMDGNSHNYSAGDAIVGVNADKDTLLVSNEAQEGTIAISKKAIGQNSELSGSVFKLEMKLASNNYVEIYSWTSANLARAIKVTASGSTVEKNASNELVSIPAGDYRLTEVLAPSGFVKYATPVEFKVDLTGSNALITVTSGEDAQRAYVVTSGAHNTLTISNEPVVVYVDKQNILNGDEILGAGLKITDENGNVIDSWTSTLEPHKIRANNFILGKTYTLTEEVVPEGYKKIATKVKFTVNSDGSVSSGSVVATLVTGEKRQGAKLAEHLGKPMIILNNAVITKPANKPEKPNDDDGDDDTDEPSKQTKELPKTGGVVGSVALMVIALMMVMAGVMMIMPEKKTRKVRKNRKDQIDILVKEKYEDVD